MGWLTCGQHEPADLPVAQVRGQQENALPRRAAPPRCSSSPSRSRPGAPRLLGGRVAKCRKSTQAAKCEHDHLERQAAHLRRLLRQPADDRRGWRARPADTWAAAGSRRARASAAHGASATAGTARRRRASREPHARRRRGDRAGERIARRHFSCTGGILRDRKREVGSPRIRTARDGAALRGLRASRRGFLESLDRALHRHGAGAHGALAGGPGRAALSRRSLPPRPAGRLARRGLRPGLGRSLTGAHPRSRRWSRCCTSRRSIASRGGSPAVAGRAGDLGRGRGRGLPAAGRVAVPVQLRHRDRRRRADVGGRRLRGAALRRGRTWPASACSPRSWPASRWASPAWRSSPSPRAASRSGSSVSRSSPWPPPPPRTPFCRPASPCRSSSRTAGCACSIRRRPSATSTGRTRGWTGSACGWRSSRWSGRPGRWRRALACLAAAVSSPRSSAHARRPPVRGGSAAGILLAGLAAVPSGRRRRWPRTLSLIPPLVRVIPPVIAVAAALAARLRLRAPRAARLARGRARRGALDRRRVRRPPPSGGRLRRALRRLLSSASHRRRASRGLLALADRAAPAMGAALPRLTAAALLVFLLSASLATRRSIAARLGPRAHRRRKPPPAGARRRDHAGRAGRPLRAVPAGGSPGRLSRGGVLQLRARTCAIRSGSSSSSRGTSTRRARTARSRSSRAVHPTSLLYANVLAVGEGQRAFGTDYLRRLDAAARARSSTAAIYGPAPRRARASATPASSSRSACREARRDEARSGRLAEVRAVAAGGPRGRALGPRRRRRRAADEPGAGRRAGRRRSSFTSDRPVRRHVRTRLVVLYEDDDVLIVDKPAGLLTVPTEAREKDTLWSRALHYLQHRYGGRPYAGIVHRLDKDTSGALVFARNRAALHALQERFRRHAIDREYVALVEGSLPERGTFDADLVRTPGLRRSVARPGQEGRRAVTRFETVERLPRATHVRSGPRPAAPTRSACTSRRRAIRSWATASTAVPSTRGAAWHASSAPCPPARLPAPRSRGARGGRVAPPRRLPRGVDPPARRGPPAAAGTPPRAPRSGALGDRATGPSGRGLTGTPRTRLTGALRTRLTGAKKSAGGAGAFRVKKRKS